MNSDLWDSATDIDEMLEYCRGHSLLSNRKGRLFALACCRRILCLVRYSYLDAYLKIGERFADGKEEHAMMERASKDLDGLCQWWDNYIAWSPLMAQSRVSCPDPGLPSELHMAASQAAAALAAALDKDEARFADASGCARYSIADAVCEDNNATYSSILEDQSLLHTRILRDVVGNPFASDINESLEPARNNSHVRSIAKQIYEDGAFQELEPLYNALTGSGCTDQRVLAHLELRDYHFRGCWVVDTILELA